jgi:hypothetical protein
MPSAHFQISNGSVSAVQVGSREGSPVMSFNVSFDPNDRIVTVQVSGTVTHIDHCAAREKALQLCREKETLKILVDLRDLLTEQSSAMNCFVFGESFPIVSPKARIAHVLPKDIRARGDVKFTINVSSNRGLTTGEFETVDQARNWLAGMKG